MNPNKPAQKQQGSLIACSAVRSHTARGPVTLHETASHRQLQRPLQEEGGIQQRSGHLEAYSQEEDKARQQVTWKRTMKDQRNG